MAPPKPPHPDDPVSEAEADWRIDLIGRIAKPLTGPPRAHPAGTVFALSTEFEPKHGRPPITFLTPSVVALGLGASIDAAALATRHRGALDGCVIPSPGGGAFSVSNESLLFDYLGSAYQSAILAVQALEAFANRAIGFDPSFAFRGEGPAHLQRYGTLKKLTLILAKATGVKTPIPHHDRLKGLVALRNDIIHPGADEQTGRRRAGDSSAAREALFPRLLVTPPATYPLVAYDVISHFSPKTPRWLELTAARIEALRTEARRACDPFPGVTIDLP